jgi:hypothetical protein
MHLKFKAAHEGCRKGDVVRFEDRAEAEKLIADGVAERCTADGEPANVTEVKVVDSAGTSENT